MSSLWDGTGVETDTRLWRECLRVLKPGGHCLAFGSPRTWHNLQTAIEDAGFEVRDSIAWIYGSGFPKSLDVSKAIDKAAGAERAVVGSRTLTGTAASSSAHVGNLAGGSGVGAVKVVDVTAPATPDAKQWQGWGTALKPAWESVVHAVKPVGVTDRIGSHLDLLEDACKPSASGAARSSRPTPAGSREAMTATAHESAVTPRAAAPVRLMETGAAGGSSDLTGMSPSEWETTTCSNIVTSWKRCLAALSEPMSMSTTSTATAPTIDLTTLWSSLSQITEPSTLLSETSPDGLSSLARIVDDLFGAALLNWRATRMLTATEPATSATPHDSPDGGARLSPVVVARKPLKGTVASNVLAWGTGALNIDGCRVEGEFTSGWSKSGSKASENDSMSGPNYARDPKPDNPAGRWPANVVLDEHAAAELDRQSGTSESRVGKPRGAAHGEGWGMTATGAEYADTGGASRFFYVAKAPTSERPRVARNVLRLRADLTPAQVDHVRARLAEAGVRVD